MRLKNGRLRIGLEHEVEAALEHRGDLAEPVREITERVRAPLVTEVALVDLLQQRDVFAQRAS